MNEEDWKGERKMNHVFLFTKLQIQFFYFHTLQILFQSSFPTVLKYSRLYSNTNNEKVIRALGQSVLRNNNMFNCNIGDEYS